MKMDDIGSCDKSISQTVEHKSCRNPFHILAFGGEDQLNCINKEIVVMDSLLEKLEISDEDDLDDLLLEDRENLLVKKTNCSSIPNKEVSLFSSCNTTELKDLSKCAAILCSEALQSIPSIFAEVDLSTIQLGYENSISVNNPGEDSMLPLHDSKFISSLKGSRANKGKSLDPNLHVTWAANVHDPPVTSSSHTVRGHRHRLPKAKTSDYFKQKLMQAKPSNTSSSGDRKLSHRRSSSSAFLEARMARMQGLASKSMQAGFRMAKLEALDLAAAPNWSGCTQVCR